MPQLTKFPHIDQLRHVVATVRATAEYQNIDLPFLKFRGTVKLHGTNASVVKDLMIGDVWAQSRETILTKTHDNAGFANWAFANPYNLDILFTHYREALHSQLGYRVHDGRLAIYGEWCGKGIMKGVAINQLDKMFVVFGVKYVPEVESLQWRDVLKGRPAHGQRILGRNAEFKTWEEAWDVDEPLGQMTHWVPIGETDGIWVNTSFTNIIKDQAVLAQLESARIFDIEAFPTFEITINFNNPEGAIEELNKLTDRIDAQCPVGLAFGSDGTGEGIVWQCVDNWFGIKPGSLRFKTKGAKHKESASEKTSVDLVKVANIKAFVDGVVTEHRLEKMLEKFNQMTVQLTTVSMIKAENTPMFLKLVGEDVLREEGDVLDASGLDRKDVMKSVNFEARKWWLELCKAQPM